MRPEAGQAPQECCLRVSLMPLRLNIDQVQVHKKHNRCHLVTLMIMGSETSYYYLFYQHILNHQYQQYKGMNSVMSFFLPWQDALFFLKDFFTSLATEVELFSPPEQEGKPLCA